MNKQFFATVILFCVMPCLFFSAGVNYEMVVFLWLVFGVPVSWGAVKFWVNFFFRPANEPITWVRFLLLVPHSLYVQWICWFGGTVPEGTWYTWKIFVNMRADVTITKCHLYAIPPREYFFKAVYWREFITKRNKL